MTHLLAQEGDFVDLPVVISGPDGTIYPRSITDTSDIAFLANLGIYEVVPAVIPPGKYAVSSSRELQNGRVVESVVLADTILLVPEQISDRQFAEQLAFDGEITRAEAEEWVGAGVIPVRLSAAVDAIPDDDVRFVARMHLRGATQFLRNNVFTLTLGAILEWPAEEIDRIWREAAAR